MAIIYRRLTECRMIVIFFLSKRRYFWQCPRREYQKWLGEGNWHRPECPWPSRLCGSPAWARHCAISSIHAHNSFARLLWLGLPFNRGGNRDLDGQSDPSPKPHSSGWKSETQAWPHLRVSPRPLLSGLLVSRLLLGVADTHPPLINSLGGAGSGGGKQVFFFFFFFTTISLLLYFLLSFGKSLSNVFIYKKAP